MQRMLCMLGFLLLTSHAGACELASVLVQRFGISVEGFVQELPLADAPQRDRQDSLLRLMLNERGAILDGFQHTAYVDPTSHQAWILRTGGFSGVAEWYGPVPVLPELVTACAGEMIPAPHMSTKHAIARVAKPIHSIARSFDPSDGAVRTSLRLSGQAATLGLPGPRAQQSTAVTPSTRAP